MLFAADQYYVVIPAREWHGTVKSSSNIKLILVLISTTDLNIQDMRFYMKTLEETEN